MANRNIVVIGASAGGVIALKELIAALPASFKAPIFIVQHISPGVQSQLPAILNSAGSLKAQHPKDGDPILPGNIYVAPPDHHLLIEEDHVVVRRGPKENRFRPSIDALFRSAAYTFGTQVIGIVMTGLLNDGTSGMWTVKRLGGIGIIQKPEEAMYSSMPESVLEYVEVDHIVTIAQMALLLVDLTQETAPINEPVLPLAEEKRIETEVNIAAEANAFESGILTMGTLSPLTCPECNGALVSFHEGKLVRYRCHTGHAYTASALLAELTKSVEDILWSGVRGLEETVILLEQSEVALFEAGDSSGAAAFSKKARETRERARQLHQFVYQNQQFNGETTSKN